MAFTKFAIGQKRVLRFKYDTPKEKDGQYGKQYLYSVEVFTDRGEEVAAEDEYGWTWAATEAAHKIVSGAELGKGDELAVWRKEEKKYTYFKRNPANNAWVKLSEPEEFTPASSSDHGKHPDGPPTQALDFPAPAHLRWMHALVTLRAGMKLAKIAIGSPLISYTAVTTSFMENKTYDTTRLQRDIEAAVKVLREGAEEPSGEHYEFDNEPDAKGQPRIQVNEKSTGGDDLPF